MKLPYVLGQAVPQFCGLTNTHFRNKYREAKDSRNPMEILRDLLKSTDQEWAKSKELVGVLRPILMRLCAR